MYDIEGAFVFAQEASMYCQYTLENILRLEKYVKNHKKRTSNSRTAIQVLYEDFMKFPLLTVEEIYFFLNETVPENIKEQFWDVNAESVLSKLRADRWKLSISKASQNLINFCCKNLLTYTVINFDSYYYWKQFVCAP